jgi:hypothetical protein
MIAGCRRRKLSTLPVTAERRARPERASPRYVTPHAFDVLRLPIVSGRGDRADAVGAPTWRSSTSRWRAAHG